MENNQIVKKWLESFGKNVPDSIIKNHVTSCGNHLWHIFTWGEVSCIEGDTANSAFDKLHYHKAIKFYGGYSAEITNISTINKVTSAKIDKERHTDVYIVAKDFSWTYVHTHESDCGPYFYTIK